MGVRRLRSLSRAISVVWSVLGEGFLHNRGNGEHKVGKKAIFNT
jgi:hypothetical protein